MNFTDEKKRFNYAPSFSVDDIPEKKRAEYIKWLKGFSYLTIREDQGAKIIRDLPGREAQVVLDPALLLPKELYDQIKTECKEKPQDDYILTRFLGIEPKGEVENIASQLGLDIFRITKPITVSPDKFLDAVDKAKLILTDSYHVTIFSMIYHKPFINFMRAGGESMNSRFTTLYRMTGVENRVWGSCGGASDWMNLPYDEIDRTIKGNREKSLNALAIQGL